MKKLPVFILPSAFCLLHFFRPSAFCLSPVYSANQPQRQHFIMSLLSSVSGS